MGRLEVSVPNSIDNYAVNIGFIDSGVGGLLFAIDAYLQIKPLVAKVIERNINVNFYHLGDTHNIPYGNRNNEEILKLSEKMFSFLSANYGCDYTIIACNTISVAAENKQDVVINKAFKTLTDNTGALPIVGYSAKRLYEEGVAYAADSDEIKLGIFATKYTLDTGGYQRALEELHAKAKNGKKMNIYTYNFKNWVNYIESGDGRKEEVLALVNQELEEAMAQEPGLAEVPVIGLFCTHYPLYEKEISSFYQSNGKDVRLLNQGKIFSPHLAYMIEEIAIRKKLEGFDNGNRKKFSIISKVTGNCKPKIHRIIKSLYSEEIEDVIDIQEVNL